MKLRTELDQPCSETNTSQFDLIYLSNISFLKESEVALGKQDNEEERW